MTWVLWISFATVSAVNIITPGPANMNTIRRAVQLGGHRVVPTILGNSLGLAVGGALCAAGIASFVTSSPVLWLLCRWLGIGYVTWLGLKMLLSRDTLAWSTPSDRSAQPMALFFEAFGLAATNPKALLFYLALFPQVLDPTKGLAPQASILILTYCGLSILSLSVYTALAHLLRTRFMTQSRYNRFRRASGLILLGFAAKLWVSLA